jgi:hypothetical protein
MATSIDSFVKSSHNTSAICHEIVSLLISIAFRVSFACSIFSLIISTASSSDLALLKSFQDVISLEILFAFSFLSLIKPVNVFNISLHFSNFSFFTFNSVFLNQDSLPKFNNFSS